MQINIKDGTDSRRGQWTHCTDNPYNPQKESYRWVSVADLMSLKNILENYKYHTLKEIEDIIGYGQDVFEIKDRSDVLIEIEDGLNMIEDCLHPEDGDKAEEEKPSASGEGAESTEKKEDVINAIKNIIDKLYQNNNKVQAEDLFANPELVKKWRAHMARNVFTYKDEDKDDN
jgi:hypothetical protein